MFNSNINSFYVSHDKERICQGDILQNFKIIYLEGEKLKEAYLPYVVVLSQDCDLCQCKDNKLDDKQSCHQYLPNIMILPAFLTEEVREGFYLNVKHTRMNSEQYKKIQQNKDERYFLLKEDREKSLNELIIDFKIYYTIPYNDVKKQYNDKYLTTINELFRENLSIRFSHYLSRIGLPELNE